MDRFYWGFRSTIYGENSPPWFRCGYPLSIEFDLLLLYNEISYPAIGYCRYCLYSFAAIARHSCSQLWLRSLVCRAAGYFKCISAATSHHPYAATYHLYTGAFFTGY